MDIIGMKLKRQNKKMEADINQFTLFDGVQYVCHQDSCW